MSLFKRKHIVDELHNRGLHTAAHQLLATPAEEINYDNGMYAGIAIAELLADFVDTSESLPEPSQSLSDDAMPDTDFSVGGGDFGGGGAGGDF